MTDRLGVACKDCPFRIGARVVYDSDALEALHDGCEPSCHQRVGMESIFREYAPTKKRCHGYDAWMRDEPGFAMPNARLTAPDTAHRSDDAERAAQRREEVPTTEGGLMNDRELLELAAKAADMDIGFDRPRATGNVPLDWDTGEPWNPLTDDGDALRLAVKLRLSHLWQHDWLMVYRGDDSVRERDLSDPLAATRRAIVRAAAEIGKGV